VPPHGGTLKPLLVRGEELGEIKARIKEMPQVRLSSRETSDLIMLAAGAFSPLDGFMRRDDYLRVVKEMRMTDGTLWPIPITLSVRAEEADNMTPGREISLIDDETGVEMGVMRVEEKYPYDKRREVLNVFRTEDETHPGVAKVYAQGDILLAGGVRVISEGPYPSQYGSYYARPHETRSLFSQKGWQSVAAFQTRNPIHRSHEYCTKIALEICDGLFIHPLVGKLKKGDIPADIRMKCYQTLLQHYFPDDRVVLKVYPMEMRYAGPREAVLHGIFRQNYGCSHLIIGRDHAGVGDYYGPFDAQKIFDEIDSNELAIKPLKIDWTFWCYRCDGMASMKTCPHGKEDRLLISGTKLREMFRNSQEVPKEFSRPEVLEILKDFYAAKGEE